MVGGHKTPLISLHTDTLAKLYNYGRGCRCGCGDGILPIALAGDSGIIDNIKQGDTNAAIDALQQRYAGGFDKSVTTSFGAGHNYPDLERKLRLNASRFGTYKAYDAAQRLGGLVGDGDFDSKAKQLLNRYNGYQKTEYNTLVARGRTAKQFERFKEEFDLYPNIEWLHTRSATPRETHLAFVGTILPQSDPFWLENQPGNEYGCKCDWRTTDKPATSQPTQIVPAAEGLNGNPAETGELITGEHPYFKRNDNAPAWLENKAILHSPDEVSFVEKVTPHGSYKEHLLVGGAHEAADNRAVAELLLANGYKDIKLMPQIDKTERRLRERYFGKDYVAARPAKNPDMLLGGNLVESKGSNRRNLSQQILKASRQADSVIIRLNESMTADAIENFIKGQWILADRTSLKEIIIYMNGELRVFKRP